MNGGDSVNTGRGTTKSRGQLPVEDEVTISQDSGGNTPSDPKHKPEKRAASSMSRGHLLCQAEDNLVSNEEHTENSCKPSTLKHEPSMESRSIGACVGHIESEDCSNPGPTNPTRDSEMRLNGFATSQPQAVISSELDLPVQGIKKIKLGDCQVREESGQPELHDKHSESPIPSCVERKQEMNLVDLHVKDQEGGYSKIASGETCNSPTPTEERPSCYPYNQTAKTAAQCSPDRKSSEREAMGSSKGDYNTHDLSAMIAERRLLECAFPFSQPPSGPVTFNIVLNCIPTKTKTEKILHLEQLPETVLEVKEHIQSNFKVPRCCQALYFDSMLLHERETLYLYRMRDGDTLHVRYNSEADIEEILDIISTMRKMIPFIESIQPELSEERVSHDLDVRIAQNVQATLVESLAYEYFFPCASDKADANRLFFIDNGGLDLMHDLHSALVQQPWRLTPLEMQYLEHAILRTLWNLTASFLVRTEVLKRPTLNTTAQSMLRVQILPNKQVKALSNRFARRLVPESELDRIAAEVVYKASGTICNLVELPECRLQIASNEKLLDQFVAIMLTPTYKYIASQVTVAGLLSLAYSPETHPHLTKPHIMEGVMETCNIQRTMYNISAEERKLECLLLKYFATMLFAHLVAWSPELIPPSLLPTIHTFITFFLNTADYHVIQEHETKNGYIWSTIVPFVNLAYFPYSNRKFASSHCDPEEREIIENLQQLCIEAGVFSLQNMLSGTQVREIMVQEKLVDYIICIPWYVPPGSHAQERAHELVSRLSQTIQLQPPRLVTMVRAKLAALHFGLEKVLRTVSVHELLSELYQSS